LRSKWFVRTCAMLETMDTETRWAFERPEYELIGPSSFGDKTAHHAGSIPSVLLQVVDRHDQVRSIHSSLKRNQAAQGQFSKPLVFIVLGSSDDGQQGLPQLYREDILPGYLERSPESCRGHLTLMSWPPSGFSLDALRQDLIGALLLPTNASDKQIQQRLIDGVGSHTIAHYVTAASFAPVDAGPLLQVIALWVPHPKGSRGKLVTIFFCLQYPSSLLRFGDRRRLNQLYEQIRVQFQSEPTVTCLPPLTAISRDHVIDWASVGVP